MMFPVFIPVTPENMKTRVRSLETGLAMSLGLLSTLLSQIERKLGPGFLNEELEGFTSCAPDVTAFVARIDELIEQGQQPAAAREFRAFTSVTWDEAHDTVAHWSDTKSEEKVRSLQLATWAKSILSNSKPQE